MRPIRKLARPLVAAPFVVTGLETLRDPRPRAEQVAPLLKPLVDRMPWLAAREPEKLVRLQAGLSLGTGILLAVGRCQRLTAALLAVQALPAVLAEHRYWTEDDPEQRRNERNHLLKNLSLLGALLIVATEPRKRSRSRSRSRTRAPARPAPRAAPRATTRHVTVRAAPRSAARPARVTARTSRR